MPLWMFSPVRKLVLQWSTCFAVRQSAASPALHRSTAGSNLQAIGLVIRLSLTPSMASQAFMTA